MWEGREHDHQADIRATGRHGPCNRLPEMQLALEGEGRGRSVALETGSKHTDALCIL